MDGVSSRPKCVLYCQEATWRWEEDEWMDGWWSPGMGQLQVAVAVAGLGEGGLWQGMRAGQGTWYPGTWASGHVHDTTTQSAGGSRPPLSQQASKLARQASAVG